jgi:leucyl aminopeptidase (aminopeptidase T)
MAVVELDKQWALREIDTFLHSSERVHTPAPNRSADVRYQRDSDTVVARHAEVVERIVDQLTPTWRSAIPVSERHRWDQLREAASRAQAVLEREDEVRINLGDGRRITMQNQQSPARRP